MLKRITQILGPMVDRLADMDPIKVGAVAALAVIELSIGLVFDFGRVVTHIIEPVISWMI